MIFLELYSLLLWVTGMVGKYPAGEHKKEKVNDDEPDSKGSGEERKSCAHREWNCIDAILLSTNSAPYAAM